MGNGQTTSYVVDLTGSVRNPSGDVDTFQMGAELTRVTTILHSVFSESFAGASYWGAKLGLAWGANLELDDENLDVEYAKYKKSDLAPNTVRDKAAKRGTSAHSVLELLAKGNTIDTVRAAHATEWDGYCEGVVNYAEDAWFTISDDVELLAERTLVSLKWQVAGTCDLMIRQDDSTTILDLKTHGPAKDGRRRDGTYAEGHGPAYTSELFQLDAYACMAEENGLGPVSDVGVILVDADGSWCIDDRQVPRGSFEHVLDVYKAMKSAG